MARVIRANHDTAVSISRPPVIKQALSKLSKPSLAALALAWLDDPNLHPVAQKRKRQRLNNERDSDDSEESEDEEELEEDLKELYEGIRDDAGVSRTKLVETMVGQWVSSAPGWPGFGGEKLTRRVQNRGLTFRQVAQIDVQCTSLADVCCSRTRRLTWCAKISRTSRRHDHGQRTNFNKVSRSTSLIPVLANA